LFEVCDDGEGASEEHLDKIFNRFYRVDSSRSREKGGTGLGLAICKGIIDAHGGRIYASQNTPRGLCICFTIPIKKQ
jgi:signal transduction histidine kinase